MKEEFTTEMHSELIEKDIRKTDLKILAVFGRIQRGVSKKKALSFYGISEKEYNDNISRLLNS